MPSVTPGSSRETVDESALNLRSALNEAIMLGLAAQDNANLPNLLSQFFGDGVSSDNDEDEKDRSEEEEEEFDLGNNEHADEEPEDMDIDSDEYDENDVRNHGNDGVVPDFAQEIIGIEGTDEWTSPDNDEELDKINNFKNCTCARNAAKDNPCTNKFENTFILQLRARMTDAKMTSRERKMFIMGRISATIRTKTTQCTKRARQKERKRSRVTYLIEGVKVCRKAFFFMHK